MCLALVGKGSRHLSEHAELQPYAFAVQKLENVKLQQCTDITDQPRCFIWHQPGPEGKMHGQIAAADCRGTWLLTQAAFFLSTWTGTRTMLAAASHLLFEVNRPQDG